MNLDVVKVSLKVPQGSVLGPVLFKIFTKDVMSNVDLYGAAYVDKTTSSIKGNNPELNRLIDILLEDTNTLFAEDIFFKRENKMCRENKLQSKTSQHLTSENYDVIDPEVFSVCFY